jgi:hypothetical protein
MPDLSFKNSVKIAFSGELKPIFKLFLVCLPLKNLF